MITIEQYFAGKFHTLPHEEAACLLLTRENALYTEFCMLTSTLYLPTDIDPDTGTEISGSRDGRGDGGFRESTSTTGKTDSAHKQARAVDRYDPADKYDNWISKFDSDEGRRNVMLEKHKLYREHPSATPGWAHITTRAPASGKRTYYP
jgi:hypothetical protein